MSEATIADNQHVLRSLHDILVPIAAYKEQPALLLIAGLVQCSEEQ